MFTFVMQYENASFQEAVKLLAERAGVSLPDLQEGEEARKRDSKRARLLEVNKEAARYFIISLEARQGRLDMPTSTKDSLARKPLSISGWALQT